jgi:hypothetical protein
MTQYILRQEEKFTLYVSLCYLQSSFPRTSNHSQQAYQAHGNQIL